MWRYFAERPPEAVVLCLDEAKFHLSDAVKKLIDRYEYKQNTRELNDHSTA